MTELRRYFIQVKINAKSYLFSRSLSVAVLLLIFFTYIILWKQNIISSNTIEKEVSQEEFSHDRYSPLIFVGGVPRSGTTLMRSLLDTHPDVKCGRETHVIPIFLRQVKDWLHSNKWIELLDDSGVTRDVILTSAANFLLGILTGHGESARILCNKDPYVLSQVKTVHAMFPNSKFLLMIRDGRAVIRSIMNRDFAIRNFNASTQKEALVSWNNVITEMLQECDAVGPKTCMRVYYEQLVLHPEQITKNIFQFVNIAWTPDVLHHEKFVGKSGGIALSRRELSTSQVIKPINLEALTTWVNWLEPEVRANISNLAPILVKLGYDVISENPNYGTPDEIVKQNFDRIKSNMIYWEKQVQKFLSDSEGTHKSQTKPINKKSVQ